MSKLILSIIFLFISSATFTGSIYSFSVSTIEGHNKPISAYQGKKIMIVTLPTQQSSSNDSLLHSLNLLRDAYSSSMVIIAVPTYENGYTPAKKNELKQWYRSILGIDIIVTEGLRARKTPGNNQHPLFKWLTHETQNDHFDIDADGVGKYFIVSKTGTLHSVLPREVPPSSLNQVLQQNMQ